MSVSLSNRPASILRETKAVADPAERIGGMPPNFGEQLMPHVVSFVGITSGVARVYRPSDEALKNSFENARFMLNDIMVTECLEQRRRSTALLDWHLEPDNERDPKQKWLAEQLQAILEVTPNFMQFRESLLYAIWYGRYANQLRYRWKKIRGEMRLAIDRWYPVNGDKLVFRFDDGTGTYDCDQVGIRVGAGFTTGHSVAKRWGESRLKKVQPTDYGLAYFLDDWERPLVAIHRHMIEDGEYEDPLSAGRINGVGIRHRVYWAWYQKQESLAFLMEYLERSASGIEIWYYPWGNSEARERTQKAAEERIGAGRNIVLVPRPMGEEGMAYGVERIEPSMAGADALDRIIREFFGHQIKRYILGQTLTTEAGSTGLGSNLASVHLDTYMQIIRYDATNLEETMTTEVVEPVKAFNFPQYADIPVRFKIDTEAPDVESKLAAWEKAYQMGLKLRAQDVMDLIGASKPDAGDEVLEDPQHRQAAMQEAQMQQAAMAQQQAPPSAQVQGFNPAEPQIGAVADHANLTEALAERGLAANQYDAVDGSAKSENAEREKLRTYTAGGEAEQYRRAMMFERGRDWASCYAKEWEEKKHPRDLAGEFAEKGHGSSGGYVGEAQGDLFGGESKRTWKQADFRPAAKARQQTMFHGLNDLPGQQDLFNDLDAGTAWKDWEDEGDGHQGTDTAAEQPGEVQPSGPADRAKTKAEPATAATEDEAVGRQSKTKAAGEMIRAAGKKLPKLDDLEAILGPSVTQDEAAEIMQHAGIDELTAIDAAYDMQEKAAKRNESIQPRTVALIARKLIVDADKETRLQEALAAAGDATSLEFGKEGSEVRFLVHPATQANKEGRWQITRIDKDGPSGHQHHKTRAEAIGAAIGAHPEPYWDEGDSDYRVINKFGQGAGAIDSPAPPTPPVAPVPEPSPPQPSAPPKVRGKKAMQPAVGQKALFRRRAPHDNPLVEQFAREFAARWIEVYAKKHKPAAGQKGLWDEADHPREDDGRFTEKGSGSIHEPRDDKQPPEAPKTLPDAKDADPAEESHDEPAGEPDAHEEAVGIDPDDSPREAAGNLFDDEEERAREYIYARQSKIGNAGEDLLGSARHKVNAWRGLEEAERDGTAVELVTRDRLLKNEPHNLMVSADDNPLTALAMHYALAKFPAKPGYAKSRTRSSEDEAAKDRRQYLEAYRRLKTEAERLAATERDPAAAIEGFSQATVKLIQEFRGQKGSDSMARLSAPDRYNNTANALTDLVKLTSRSRASNSRNVYRQLSDFGRKATEVYDDIGANRDRIAEHAKDIIEGMSLNETFGMKKEGEAGPKRFNPADHYVAHANRKGGRKLSADTANQAVKYMVERMKLRGVQWGNSVTDDEREHHAVKAAEAMMDLADVLGLDDAEVSIGGKLGFAIGARGKGNALAHYEPGNVVINLTRKGGVGSLAHEWGHYFDHQLAGGKIVHDPVKGKLAGDYYSQWTWPRRGIKDEKGGWVIIEDEKGRKRIKEENLTQDPLWQAYEKLRKAWTSSGFTRRLGSVVGEAVRSGAISKGKRSYWTSNAEVFARTFERYIQRKLEQDGRENTYLAGNTTRGDFWPTDEETDQMVEAFDAVFAAYRDRKTPTAV